MPVTVVPPETPSTPRPDVIDVGLLNNLSDAGLEHGERQFLALLAAASGALRIRLRLFSLPSIERGAQARAHIAKGYGDLAALERARLDGLFVSGAEPRAAHLRDEAFWPQLTAAIDWARTGTSSTMLSCLAAHAAVSHLDGIERRRLPAKCTGVFAVTREREHPLLAGIGEAPHTAHSRWNGLDDTAVAAAGWTVLTRAAGGPDIFGKDVGSLFICLQGHPEYDAGALGREYRRDVARFLSGADDVYPTVPANYFDAATESALRRFERRAWTSRQPAMTHELPATAPPAGHGTQAFATALFGNWLQMLGAKAVDRAA